MNVKYGLICADQRYQREISFTHTEAVSKAIIIPGHRSEPVPQKCGRSPKMQVYTSFKEMLTFDKSSVTNAGTCLIARAIVLAGGSARL